MSSIQHNLAHTAKKNIKKQKKLKQTRQCSFNSVVSTGQDP